MPQLQAAISKQQFTLAALFADGFFFGFAPLCGLDVVNVLCGAALCCSVKLSLSEHGRCD